MSFNMHGARVLATARHYAQPLVCFAAAAIWLLAPVVLWSPLSDGVVTTARTAVAMLGLGVTTWTLRARRGLGLMSPPYLLGVLALLFYSLAPALYLQLIPTLPSPLLGSNVMYTATVVYVGGRGELLILQFTALCFLIAVLVTHHSPGATSVRTNRSPDIHAIEAYGAAALALVLAFLVLFARTDHMAAEVLTHTMKGELTHAIPPVLSVCLATVAFFASGGTGRHAVLAIVLIIVTTGSLFVAGGLATVPLYISIAAILLLALRRWVGLPRLACLGVAIAGLVVIAIVGRAVIHPNALNSYKGLRLHVETTMYTKLVQRQAVSGACLTRIAEQYAGIEDAGPFYFFRAVVPRALWPEKPNLSRGHEFAVQYCGQKDADRNHSESITLLGEPILAAGAAGLLVAELFIALLVGGAAVIGFSGGGVRLVAMTAMLPWLALFQQHFAQYVANALKMFLIMLPFLLLLAWAARHNRIQTSTRRQLDEQAPQEPNKERTRHLLVRRRDDSG